MPPGTQSTTTMQPAVRQHLQELCAQGEDFLTRFSAALHHDAQLQRQAAEVHQPITEEDLKAEVAAMTDTLNGWIPTPGAGGLAQFVLPQLFRACFEEVAERYNFIRSIFFPPGASTTNTTTTAMRDHIVEHHEALFHLTPVEEQEKAINRVLNRVGEYLVTRRSFPEDEVAQVVWKSDLGKVAVAYLRIVVRERIQDPAVRFEGSTKAQRATAAASSMSNSQTDSGVNVVRYNPELHSDPVRGDNRDIIRRRCTVIFPAILGQDGARLTRSYTVRFNANEDKNHPELGTSSSSVTPSGGDQGGRTTSVVNDPTSMEGDAQAQARNTTGGAVKEERSGGGGKCDVVHCEGMMASGEGITASPRINMYRSFSD
ncbi:unnamed protein product [Ectocarpus sp. 8 AP-2014]